MPRLLDRIPFSEKPGEVAFRGERVPVRADQIIVWVSLSLKRVSIPNPRTVPFPAILDTGYSHSFAITESHLLEWAELRAETLAVVGAVRDRSQRIYLHQANLWIHTNQRGSRDRLADRLPNRIMADLGIAVYPTRNFPRLPILGLRVIAENGLNLKVDGSRREATLRTPYRWWPFS